MNVSLDEERRPSQKKTNHKITYGQSPHFHQKILLLSILLHLLFFALWENITKLGLFTEPLPAPTLSEPLTLDIQPDKSPEKSERKEVIETPADAKTTEKPQKADFLSDKNALARNPEVDKSKPISTDPYSQGDLDTHSLPPTPKPAPDNSDPPQPQQPEKDYKNLLDTNSYVKESFQKKLEQEAQSRQSQQERTGISHEQLASRVNDMGGLAFNTYNWNFAPYMLRLKALIEQNIHPPHAFTHLGLISGITLLRFKIYPNGVLKDLEVLDYNGHITLMETSTSAVQLSAPFPDLPTDFPEPFLQVTGKFIYMIRE